MNSHTTRQFRTLFAALPTGAQRQAREAYRLFRQNPAHPGLRFKKLFDSPSLYSARVGISYRAVGARDGNSMIWFWMGSHAGYEKLLKLL